jgi:hypothetical protein
MGNHGFVTTKKWLTGDRLEKDLKEIIEERFQNKVPYTREDDYFEIGFNYPWKFGCWIENCHKVEFRNPNADWCWWAMAVIQNELALRYNGLISDEGVGEKWKGVANKYPTFRNYIEARLAHMKNPTKWILKHLFLFCEVHSNAPKEVKEMCKIKK